MGTVSKSLRREHMKAKVWRLVLVLSAIGMFVVAAGAPHGHS